MNTNVYYMRLTKLSWFIIILIEVSYVFRVGIVWQCETNIAADRRFFDDGDQQSWKNFYYETLLISHTKKEHVKPQSNCPTLQISRCFWNRLCKTENEKGAFILWNKDLQNYSPLSYFHTCISHLQRHDWNIYLRSKLIISLLCSLL